MAANPPFFDLTVGADNFVITSGLLATLPGGLRGLTGNDTIAGSSGADLVLGGADNDRLLGALGNDTLYGDLGNDNLFGEADNDIISGMQGQDFINGGDGNDLLRGGKGDDYLVGGNGNDTLIGDRGININVGGAGSDVFVFRQDLLAGTEIDTITQNIAQVILDFDVASDLIGLGGGLQVNQLSFSTVVVTPNQAFTAFVATQRGARFVEEGNITVQSFDPDGNGFAEITSIRLGANGPFVTSILSVTPAQISGRFIQVNI